MVSTEVLDSGLFSSSSSEKLLDEVQPPSRRIAPLTRPVIAAFISVKALSECQRSTTDVEQFYVLLIGSKSAVLFL